MLALWRISAHVFAGFFVGLYVCAMVALPVTAYAQTAVPTAPHPILCPQGSVANAQGQCVTAKSVPPTCFITVNPTSISVGGSVTVKWQSTNATAGAITNIGNVGPSGSINLLPSSAGATYFGSFTGPGGTANCQATVVVNTSGAGGGTTDTTQTNPVNVGTAISVTNQTPVAAQGSGLVPCGYGAYNGNGLDQGASTGCQACNLAQLIQNLINFLIGIAIPIAAALFAYAGWLYFTSAAKPGNINTAKKIFSDALLGFALAISAWLIVNTFLHVIFSQGAFANGSWFTIQCDTANRTVNGNIGTLLSQIPILSGGAVTGNGNIYTNGSPRVSGGGGGGGNGATSGIGTDSYTNTLQALTDDCIRNGDDASCNAANDFQNNHQMTTAVQDVLSDDCGDNPGGASCAALGPSSGSTGGPRGVAQCSSGNDNCSVEQLQGQGLTDAQAQAMSCIAITENSGNAVNCSGTGPCGTFQISQTNWKQYAPSDCQASNFNGNITAAQNNAQCNLQTASIMVQAQGYQPWTGNNNGVYWNPAARTCVSNYDPSNLH